MKVKDLIKELKDFGQEELGSDIKVIGIDKTDDGWRAKVEVVEEKEYMQVIGQHDLLAVYELELDEEGELQGYRRVKKYHRGTCQEN